MIRLYDYPTCAYAQKVKVVLEEKQLEYESVTVNLRDQEQKSAEFLKLNPYGRVPVLIDEETVIYDSTIINEYLEDEYPHPRLLPEDSAARARARLLEDYGDTSFLPSADYVLSQLALPVENQDSERLKIYQTEVQRGLSRLEAYLQGQEYLAGEFSLADICFAPRVLILPHLRIEVDARLRQVIAWIERLMERPSIKPLLPPS